jgi:hypothetical protein
MSQEKTVNLTTRPKDITIDVTGVIKSFEGKTLQDTDEHGKACDASVKISIVNGLLAHLPQDIGTVKLQKYLLAKKVFHADKVELNQQEQQLIMHSVMTVFSPMVIGGIHELFETAKR